MSGPRRGLDKIVYKAWCCWSCVDTRAELHTSIVLISISHQNRLSLAISLNIFSRVPYPQRRYRRNMPIALFLSPSFIIQRAFAASPAPYILEFSYPPTLLASLRRADLHIFSILNFRIYQASRSYTPSSRTKSISNRLFPTLLTFRRSILLETCYSFLASPPSTNIPAIRTSKNSGVDAASGSGDIPTIPSLVIYVWNTEELEYQNAI
jgi:hypothetical protein